MADDKDVQESVEAAEGELFAGTESATTDTSPGQKPVGPTSKVDPREFLADLSYREVHAFVLGFGPVLVGLLLAAFSHDLALPFLTGSALLFMAAIGERKVPTRFLRYVVKEPHYLVGGQAVAGTVGSLLLAMVVVARTVGAAL